MSGDKYKISDQHARYFMTLTVVNWIDIFSRREYKDIVVDSLNYCTQNKGLEIYTWVIMTNHVHLVAGCLEPYKMSDFLRDFKKFTSKKIVDEICEIPESRREWLLDKFAFEASRIGRAKDYKLWRDDNHAIDLDGYGIEMMQKIIYVHENPVRAGIVRNPEDYVYSSAIDYTPMGMGLVEVVVV
ncbi:MAG: transposase [Cyclobacteriaceae bacterium]